MTFIKHFILYISLSFLLFLNVSLCAMGAINKVAHVIMPDGKKITFFGDHHNESGGDKFCGYSKEEISRKQAILLEVFRGVKLGAGNSLLIECRKKLEENRISTFKSFSTNLQYIYSFLDFYRSNFSHFNSVENFDTRDDENTHVIFAAAWFDVFLRLIITLHKSCDVFNKKEIFDHKDYSIHKEAIIREYKNVYVKFCPHKDQCGKNWYARSLMRTHQVLNRLQSKIPPLVFNRIMERIKLKDKIFQKFLFYALGTFDCSNLLEKLINAFETKEFEFLTNQGDIYQLFFYTFAKYSSLYVDLGLLEKILDHPNKNIIVCGGYMHCDDVIEYLKLLGGSVKQVDMFSKRMIEDVNYAMSQLEGLLK